MPERSTYRPGDSARIMIQSPWERATALLTTEREGVRTHRQFALTSSQQYVTVPITEDDIPNVYVSVLLMYPRRNDGLPGSLPSSGVLSFVRPLTSSTDTNTFGMSPSVMGTVTYCCDEVSANCGGVCGHLRARL